MDDVFGDPDVTVEDVMVLDVVIMEIEVSLKLDIRLPVGLRDEVMFERVSETELRVD